jgi:HEAT repeat protein
MSGSPNYSAPPAQPVPGYGPAPAGYRPAPPQPPPKSGGGGNGCILAAIVVLIVVGIPTILLCAGIGFVFYLGKSAVDEAQAKVEETRAKMEAERGAEGASFAPLLSKAPQEKPITNVDDAIEALGMDHFSMPMKGADWLVANPVDQGKRAAAVKALRDRMEKPHNSQLSDRCIKALGKWGTKEDAPAVAKMLKTFGIDRRQTCEVLADWKDPVVAPEIAALLEQRGADGDAAERALEKIGKGCEAAVRAQLTLDHKDASARAERVLASYGVDVADAVVTARLADIKSGDGTRRREAAKRLADMPLKAERQTEVARALDSQVTDRDHGAREEALKALLVWGDKTSAVTVARFVKAETFSNKNAVAVLAKLKEPSTIDAFVHLFDNAFISDVEFNKAVIAFGPEGEKAALASMHDSRHRAQERARAILADMGTKPDVLLTQTLKDMSSTDNRRAESALKWLSTANIDDSRRAEVADKLGPALKSIPRHLQAAALDVLVRCNSPSGIAALGEMIRDKGDQRRVSDAFHKAGPASEDVLISLLTAGDPIVAGYACSGLQNYGSEKCIMPLKELLRKTGSTNKQLTMVARTALEAVQKRTNG